MQRGSIRELPDIGRTSIGPNQPVYDCKNGEPEGVIAGFPRPKEQTAPSATDQEDSIWVQTKLVGRF